MKPFKLFLIEKRNSPTLAQTVQGLGKASGLEHAAIRDFKTRRESGILQGSKTEVDPAVLHGFKRYESPDGLQNTGEYPEHIVVHSHPVDGGLSVGDANHLISQPSLKTLHAVTPSGSLYSAKMTPLGRQHGNNVKDGTSRLEDGVMAAAKSFNNSTKDMNLSFPERVHLQGHIIHTALHHMGLIRYRASMKGKDRLMTAKYKKLIDSEVGYAKKNIAFYINKK